MKVESVVRCGQRITFGNGCPVVTTVISASCKGCDTMTQHLLPVWNIQVYGVLPYTVAPWDDGSPWVTGVYL